MNVEVNVPEERSEDESAGWNPWNLPRATRPILQRRGQVDPERGGSEALVRIEEPPAA